MASLAGSVFCFIFVDLLVMGSMAYDVSTANDTRKTYIVLASHSRMPTIFSSPTSWYMSTLASVRREISSAAGADDAQIVTKDQQHSTDIIYTYQHSCRGFAARLTDLEASSLASQPGFLSVMPDKRYELQTTYTPEFMGLMPSAGLWKKTSLGADVIVGFLDTGIWPESSSLDDTGMGPVPKRWKGRCVDGGDFNSSVCNKKLIGARYFLSSFGSAGSLSASEYRSPRDVQGHGTHTASTTAGAHVANASFFGYANGTAKGVAPGARIAVYKVCWASFGGCMGADLLAAIDEAIADGVDIISISLGGSSVPLQEDPLAVGSFGALRSGVFVSCAAGNGGPSPGSILNNAPWILTVAASTVDRNFPATVKLGNGEVYVGQSLYTGDGAIPVQKPLVSLGFCDEASFRTENAEGNIVICQQSSEQEGRSTAAVVAAAGGVGEIMVQQKRLGHSIISSGFLLPSMNVDAMDGAAIQDYASAGENSSERRTSESSYRRPSATISIQGTRFGRQRAPKVAGFSSRGPNPLVRGILKPDIAAPGVTILGAWSSAPPSSDPLDNRKTPFNIISGTSMACPHATGVAALLRAAHPDWSAAAIKSALMTSADILDHSGKPILDDYDGTPATSYGYGAGQINPNAALCPGLVYDIDVQDYVDFLCSLGFTDEELELFTKGERQCSRGYKKLDGGRNLNYPAFVVDMSRSTKGETTTLARVVTNVGPASSLYLAEVEAPKGAMVRVTPSELRFSEEGMKRSFEVKISATMESYAVTREVEARLGLRSTFGSLTWVDAHNSHRVRSPIVINWQ
ncbi:hypothetical protein KP509_03G019300 [Ceratopteris richardii]|uniref:Uncharacterized protein n=1 Tax=Ceratopteris richardii TaxID=49495 RepID=A0A8T2V9H5_CERRI|nr:hypothetical protein KP509_03G019300 [Ceratopteris richardii]